VVGLTQAGGARQRCGRAPSALSRTNVRTGLSLLAMTTADEFFSIYSQRGSSLYMGEAITVAEHSLQSAHFARVAGASDALVIAALLHDMGHLLGCVADDLGEWDIDAHHELIGSQWLATHFGPEVFEPVRLHVAAKRYLCATDLTYFRRLSAASVLTLRLQGGPMSATEASSFEADTYHRDAILLRQCDDQGKVVGLETPGFEHYRELIERLLSERQSARAQINSVCQSR
jgi:phosphonate degradation associated HDIG domain protein